MPEPGPFGETFVEASVRAMTAALLLNNPCGGWVESVVTDADQRLVFFFPVLRFLAVVRFLAVAVRGT
jgi:hypothetical protein